MMVSLVSVICASLFTGSADVLSVVEGILAIAAAYGLGALLGILILGPIFYPVVYRLVGAPFAVSDKVMILRGPRIRKIAEVYEVCVSRSQVRLRLSDEEHDAVADVFSCNEVLRINKPNKALQLTPSGDEVFSDDRPSTIQHHQIDRPPIRGS
jgi:hypothetical protein